MDERRRPVDDRVAEMQLEAKKQIGQNAERLAQTQLEAKKQLSEKSANLAQAQLEAKKRLGGEDLGQPS